MDAVLFGIDPGKHDASAVASLLDARLSFSHMSLSPGPPRNRRPFPKRAETILLKNGSYCRSRLIHAVTYQCERATVSHTSCRAVEQRCKVAGVPSITIRLSRAFIHARTERRHLSQLINDFWKDFVYVLNICFSRVSA